MSPKKWQRDYGEGHNFDESIDESTAGRVSLTITKDGVENCNLPQPMPEHEDAHNNNAKDNNSSSSWPVALYIPNLLGYLRIFLSFYGLKHALLKHASQALIIWIIAAMLDLIDGIAARKLNQCSEFGIILDIVADNILRTIVWISSMISCSKSESANVDACLVWVAIICLEWITMYCSQNKANQNEEQSTHWKDVEHSQPPFWVQAVFKNNFRSPPGVLAVYGLFVAPFGTYILYAGPLVAHLLPVQVLSMLIVISYFGRLLSAAVEIWICFDYFRSIIAMDKVHRKKKGS